MKILFLCTAHNSLSQRLCLTLSNCHVVTVEYALSEEAMLSAVALSRPDLVICPFLTVLVPKHVYENYLTLIIHPGPPGDVGPSALDWLLMGDDGIIDDSDRLLEDLDRGDVRPGRRQWGVTVLQAIEEFDAGPVWAFEQFPVDIDHPGLTKSQLYRGPVTQAAIVATQAAIERIQTTTATLRAKSVPHSQRISPSLPADPSFRLLSCADMVAFQGGKLHHRPLLKAVQRNFDITRHSSQHISRCIRCGDSQPGALTKVFGPSLYVYGGIIDSNPEGRQPVSLKTLGTPPIRGTRDEAVCLSTIDGKGVWITHIRRPRMRDDKALWPKVPAASGLLQLGLLTDEDLQSSQWPLSRGWERSPTATFQDIWIDWQAGVQEKKTAYVYFAFYNGAMSTVQCSRLIEALDFVISQSTAESPVQAVVLMGGSSYFSNGIALNVIEADDDPASESWRNINRIDDVVHHVLHEFPSRGIITAAAIRGNAAAGGVALAAACDIVIAGSGIVLNPAYRALGLFGSEYHTISYYGRCGETNARQMIQSMMPMSPLQAQAIGLVDYVFPGSGPVLEDYIRTHIDLLLQPGILKRGMWKTDVDLSPAALARARMHELGEMSLDFWSARSIRYHSRRFDFVRKVKASKTPLRFASHRQTFDDDQRDEEDREDFDSVEHFRKLAEEKLAATVRKMLEEEHEEANRSVRDQIFDSMRQKDRVSFASVADAKRKNCEPVSPCYYNPTESDMLTPPESPWSPNEIVDRISSYF